MRIIDTHCVFGRWPKEERDVGLARLVEGLSAEGFESGLAVSLRGAFDDPAAGNAETLAACARHPGLLPVGTVNPRDCRAGGDRPADLGARGFRMVRFFPHIQDWTPRNVLFERALGECAEAGLPAAFPIGKFPDLASELSRMAPKGCRMLLSNVYYNALAECVEVMRRREEFLMELGHVCVPGAVEFLVGELGADRLVLGTGQPLESSRGALEEVRTAEISEDDREAVFGGTISALLGGSGR